MLRSILAIVVGFVVIGVLAFGTDALVHAMMPGAFDAALRTDNVPILVGTIVYVTIYAIAGSYLTALLAPSRPMRHAMILGVLGLLFNIAGTYAGWAKAPAWYHITALLLVLPSAWIGGWLRERQLASAAAPLPAI